MRACASPDSSTQRVRHGAWFLALLLALLGSAVWTSASADFRVLQAGSSLAEGVHRVDARIDFRFSDDAIEAMDNGVAVTVSVRMQVLRLRPLLDETVAQVRARYRIQLHSLSRSFVVANLSTDETQTYQNFDSMIAALGQLSDFPLLDDEVLDDDENYRVRLRATLDIESLPAPMRPLAYLSSSWRLSSDWVSWPLRR
jgi:hypothetical protein